MFQRGLPPDTMDLKEVSMPDWTDALVDILFDNNFATLASCDQDRTPWVTPLVFGCDRALNFYWVSAEQARHSINVRDVPRAAVAIFDSTQTPGAVQALYSEGNVQQLANDALAGATRLFYGWRYPDPDVLANKIRGPEQFEGNSPRRMYRMIPTHMYALDPSGDPEHGSLLDYRVEVSIREPFARRYAIKYSHL